MPKLIFLLFWLQKGPNWPKMMGFKFSDPSFISWGVLDREPVGVNLAGQVTNFHEHRCKDRIAPHNKLTVWHFLSGGCGQGDAPTKKVSLLTTK